MTQSKRQSKKHRRSHCMRVLRHTDVSIVMQVMPLPGPAPRQQTRRVPTLTTRGAHKEDQFGETIVADSGSFVQYSLRARFWDFVQIKVEALPARSVVVVTLEGFREAGSGVVVRREVPVADVSVICVNGKDVFLLESASEGIVRLRLAPEFQLGTCDMFKEGLHARK